MGLLKKIDFIVKNPLFLFKLLFLRNRLKNTKILGKQVWVFQCDYAGHYPYLKPYIDRAKKSNDVEVFVAVGQTREKNPIPFLLEKGVSSSNILHPIDFVCHSNWDAYVSPTSWGNIFPANENALRVQIFHTLADKNKLYGVELLKFNELFLNGPIHHEFLKKYVFDEYPGSKEKCNVSNVGYAKIDNLFNETLQISTIREKLRISKNDFRPVILYAPNWEETSALRTYGEDIFQELASQNNLIIIIKLHYMSLLSKDCEFATGGVDWRSILAKYIDKENIHFVEEQDINEYLVVSDMLLTDYGGVSLEFLSLDKPIVYLDCPDFFKERGEDVFEYRIRNTGKVIGSVEEIIPAIYESLENDLPFKEKRRKVSSQLLYNRGMAADVGFNVIRDRVIANRLKPTL